MAESTCGMFFPSVPICDESRVDKLISSCSDMDITMSANSTYSMRFWLSYYGRYIETHRPVFKRDQVIFFYIIYTHYHSTH